MLWASAGKDAEAVAVVVVVAAEGSQVGQTLSMDSMVVVVGTQESTPSRYPSSMVVVAVVVGNNHLAGAVVVAVVDKNEVEFD